MLRKATIEDGEVVFCLICELEQGSDEMTAWEPFLRVYLQNLNEPFIEVARLLQQRGARRILASVSHVLMDDIGAHKLIDSPIERLLVTDTVENDVATSCPKVQVVSIAPLFAGAIDIIHRRESLSKLFE